MFKGKGKWQSALQSMSRINESPNRFCNGGGRLPNSYYLDNMLLPVQYQDVQETQAATKCESQTEHQ